MILFPALCSALVVVALSSLDDGFLISASTTTSLTPTPRPLDVAGVSQNKSLPDFWHRPLEHVRMLEAAQKLNDIIQITIDLNSLADLDIEATLEAKKKEKARQYGITPDLLSQAGPVTYTNAAGQTAVAMGPGDIHEFPGKLVFQFQIVTKEDMYLMQSYEKVFPSGNRNSAGFLWSNWLLSQSHQLSPELLQKYFAMFCGVSGAPLGPKEGNTSLSRWELHLKDVVGNTRRQGFMYYCTGCLGWPCLCDAQDFLRVDTKTVLLQGGVKKKYRFVVVGDPCRDEELLNTPYFEPTQNIDLHVKDVAPELICEGGQLKHSILSDHGHVMLTMFHDYDQTLASEAYHQLDYAGQCSARAASGFMSGMGMIFRKFAGVTPLDSEAEAQAKLAPTKPAAGLKTSQLLADRKDGINVTQNVAASNAFWIAGVLIASMSMMVVFLRRSMPVTREAPAECMESELAE